jgi:peptide chain release factor 1
VTEVYAGLLKRLAECAQRLRDITEQMNDPQMAGNPARIVALSKEHGRLRRIVEPYLAYDRVDRQLRENEELARDGAQDPELRELARGELPELQARREKLIEGMMEAFLTADDAAIESVIMEIRAGTGGQEAALFARDLYQMYQRYCDRCRLRLEVLDVSESDLGGFREVVMSVKGPEVYRKLGYEGGGHRVQRVPETEAQGRIHTSAATVAVLPEPEELDVRINWDADVEEHVSRAGGPGGQNVNKVSSAIRLVHRETGITVSMRDEKSQHKNRAKARRLMLSRVFDYHRAQQQQERASERRMMIGSGDRSQRIRTYNFPQNRCTDHRIGLDLYSLDKIMMGELDPLIEALQAYDREQYLRNL